VEALRVREDFDVNHGEGMGEDDDDPSCSRYDLFIVVRLV
jgi:hypothetical protein